MMSKTVPSNEMKPPAAAATDKCYFRRGFPSCTTKHVCLFLAIIIIIVVIKFFYRVTLTSESDYNYIVYMQKFHEMNSAIMLILC